MKHRWKRNAGFKRLRRQKKALDRLAANLGDPDYLIKRFGDASKDNLNKTKAFIKEEMRRLQKNMEKYER